MGTCGKIASAGSNHKKNEIFYLARQHLFLFFPF